MQASLNVTHNFWNIFSSLIGLHIQASHQSVVKDVSFSSIPVEVAVKRRHNFTFALVLRYLGEEQQEHTAGYGAVNAYRSFEAVLLSFIKAR